MEMDELEAKIAELSERIDAMQAENTALRADARLRSDQETGPGLAPSGDIAVPRDVEPMGRRQALTRALGVATLGAAGIGTLSVASAGSAAANTGDSLVLGQYNSAGTYTALFGTDNSRTTLWVVDGNSSSISYAAAVLGDSDTQNGVAGVTSSANAVGVYGVSHARSSWGYAPAAVFGDSDSHPGIYGQSAEDVGVFGRSTTQAGVLGRSNDSAGVAGESPGIGVYGLGTANDYSIGTFGGASGSHGVGVKAECDNGVALAASSNGSGQAVIAACTSSKPAVQVSNAGSGAAVTGQATKGRGGVFGGAAAAIQIVPGPLASHPKSGSRGDLYADKTGRLWFCKKSGATALWHQIA